MTSPKTIGAAHAVASWARARRAMWTDAPLPVPRPARVPPPVDIAPVDLVERDEIVQDAAGLDTDVVTDVITAPPASVPAPSASSASAFRGAIAAAAAVVVIAGGLFFWNYAARRATTPATASTTVPAPSPATSTAAPTPQPTASPATKPAPAPTAATSVTRVTQPPAVGRMTIASTPAGAKVKIDNTPKGETPLSLTDIPPGRHLVLLESPAGSVERTVTVRAGEETAVNEAIFAGWVAVFAPFEVSVAERGRDLRVDERGQIMLSPGPHDLTISNSGRAFTTSRRVVIKPGEITRLSIVP